MNVPVILGTAREGRRSEAVARFIQKILQENGVAAPLIDPREHLSSFVTTRVGKEGPESSNWQKIASEASGFFVVVPEYNRSFPGELKLLIDTLYPEYFGKPFYPVGVSDGASAGIRAVEQFVGVVVGVEGIPIKSRLYFPNILDFFDEAGNFQIDEEHYREKVIKALDSLKKLI